jgi:DNA-binding NarL/FixJ family response regulator
MSMQKDYSPAPSRKRLQGPTMSTTQPGNRWSVMVVDDHPIIRMGTRAALSDAPEFQIVGEADNADDALTLASVLRPDIVFLDIKLKGARNGVEVARGLRKMAPSTKIVVFTNFGQEAYIKAMMAIGVDAYLLKDTPPAEVVHTLRMVLQGRSVFSSEVSSMLVQAYLGRANESVKLSSREAGVMQLVADGKTNEEIADSMGVSPKAVQVHLTNIYSKLGARNRTEALVIAARNGLVVLDQT